jgi:hypothetical protein
MEPDKSNNQTIRTIPLVPYTVMREIAAPQPVPGKRVGIRRCLTGIREDESPESTGCAVGRQPPLTCTL